MVGWWVVRRTEGHDRYLWRFDVGQHFLPDARRNVQQFYIERQVLLARKRQ